MFGAALAAMSLMCLSPAASAATIGFDNTVNRGAQADGGAIPDDQDVLGHIIDDDLGTKYAMGINGELTVFFPRKLNSISIFELTSGSVPESARIYLGNNTNPDNLIAELFNKATGNLAGSSGYGGATVEASLLGRSISAFLIKLGTNTSDTITIVDTTAIASGRNNGFDIAELSYAPVPLPAAGWLMVSGLLGLAALRRRRKFLDANSATT